MLDVQKSGETVGHLLLHCEVARASWEDVFKRLELALVMPTTVLELLASWANLSSIPQIIVVWKMDPTCIMRCLWQERNN